MKLHCVRGDVRNSLVPSRNATSREGCRAGRSFWVRPNLLCASCGVEINMYDISSLIIERGGAEKDMVGSLVGGSSPSGMWRSPCFLMWSNCESDLHNCAYDLHSLFAILFPIPLILPWTLLLLFLFSIYCPKLNSSAVSLCRPLSITTVQLSSFLVPHLPQCSYCSLSNRTM